MEGYCFTPEPEPVLCEDEFATNYGEEGECLFPEPTPEPVVTQCVVQQYVLKDTEGNICYIKRNFERGDSASKLPNIYRNTPLMRTVCSSTCTGKPVAPFGKLDSVSFTCAVCDGECS